jgi:amino acid transporter
MDLSMDDVSVGSGPVSYSAEQESETPRSGLPGIKQRRRTEERSEDDSSIADMQEMDLDMMEAAVQNRKKQTLANRLKPPAETGHKHKKGCLSGVLIPTCENMWGVLIFLRFFYIVGHAGVLTAMGAVVFSFSAAILTAASLSAVASSGGFVSKGGPYYMISRAMGPNVGASVGITYFCGITSLAVLEAIGAVEAFIMVYPQAAAPFPNAYNQIYGITTIWILVFCVWGGISIVTKLANVFALCVAGTIFLFYAGIVQAEPSDDGHITGISAETLGNNLYPMWGEGVHFGTVMSIFFPCFTGILSGANRADVLKDPPRDIKKGTYGAIIFSLFMYSSFMILWGMVASGEYLKGDTQYAGDGHGSGMGSGHASGGDDMGRRLAGGGDTTYIFNDIVNWPTTMLPMVGVIVSSVSQALQCLVVAPRLLQNIATDNLLPRLAPLAPKSKAGEPVRALFATGLVGSCLCSIGSLDGVAPLLTMCFLTCYTMMNASCLVLTLLRSPSWRPPGISTSMGWWYYVCVGGTGTIMCVSIMFTVSVPAACGVIFLAGLLYQYISMQEGAAEWGSGLDGIRFNMAVKSVLALESATSHQVNWRPQVLVLYKVHVAAEIGGGTKHHEIIQFYSQLRHSKGMCIVAAVMEGNPGSGTDIEKAKVEKELIKQILQEEGVMGFSEVVVAPDWGTGTNYILQLTGLGGLKPNTVLCSWPHHWRKKMDRARDFINVLCTAQNEGMCAIVAQDLVDFPRNDDPPLAGTIDLWWILHDGGILVLLAWLLMQDQIWRKCSVRVFCVLEHHEGMDEDAAAEVALSLKKLMTAQRFGDDVAVEVIILEHLVLDPYTHEEDQPPSLQQKGLYEDSLELSGKNEAERSAQKKRSMTPTRKSSKGQVQERKQAPALADFDAIVQKIVHEHTDDHVAVHRQNSAAPSAGDGVKYVHGHKHVDCDVHHRMKDKFAEEHGLQYDTPHINNVTPEIETKLLLRMAGTTEGNAKEGQNGSTLGATAGGKRVSGQASENGSTLPSNAKSNTTPRTTGRKTKKGQQGVASSFVGRGHHDETPYDTLNREILKRSKRAQLVLINLPDVWSTTDEGVVQYCAYCETITSGLDRVVYVHSAGNETLDFHL